MRLHLLYIFSIISFSWAYYGPTDKFNGINLGINQIAFQIDRTIYSYAGIQENSIKFQDNITMQMIDDNKNLQVSQKPIQPGGFGCLSCNGFVLNDSAILIYVGYSEIDSASANASNKNNMGFLYYNPPTYTFTRPDGFKDLANSPLQRQYQSTVITPDNSSVYIFGGMGAFPNSSTDMPIVRFDMAISTYTTYQNFQMLGGTATMLPSGVVVIAFGARGLLAPTTGGLHDTTSVFLFDTKTNVMKPQPVEGSPPSPRAEATGTLGPDKECIYYFGGNDFNVNITVTPDGSPTFSHARVKMISNSLVVLNTSSWTWFSPQVTGPPSNNRYGAFSFLYDDNNIIIGGGVVGRTYLSDISVLRNLPLPGQPIQSANIQWFTNSDLDNAYAPNNGLAAGAVAGITIGVILFALLVLVILWKCAPKFRKSVMYIQTDVIWKPRSGEPLWAESSRLTVRFVLFILFIAFVVYSIYRAVQSPIQLQVEVEDVDTMQIPDVRICSQNLDSTDAQSFTITCQLLDGTDCSEYFHSIDDIIFYPQFSVGYGRPSCQLFTPPSSLKFRPNTGNYNTQWPNKLTISVIGDGTLNSTAFFVTYYAPGYDPNRVFYNISSENEKLSPTDISNWKSSEILASLMPNTFGASIYTYPVAAYSLAVAENLTDSGWNNIGFAYKRTSKLELTQHVGPLLAMPESSVISKDVPFSLTVVPSEFQITTTREIKSSTILSGFAQAGGVFGLFVAIQTLLFGFRPESPWGLVHRWSFGSLRRALTNRLTSQFDRLKTPVPIVSPVHNRFSMTPKRSNMFLFDTTPFISIDEEDTDGARIQRMEERLQLMELLFKSYYINDEVFRHLNEAIKKNADTPSMEKEVASDSSSTQTDEEVPMSQARQRKKDSPTDSPVKSNDFA